MTKRKNERSLYVAPMKPSERRSRTPMDPEHGPDMGTLAGAAPPMRFSWTCASELAIIDTMAEVHNFHSSREYARRYMEEKVRFYPAER